MEVYQESIRVAYVPQDHSAEVIYLGSIGARQADLDPMIRKRPSKAKHLIFVYEAGPGGSWLYQYWTQKGYEGWGGTRVDPPKPGDRVKTDRQDAVPLARLARSGDLTAVYVPNVKEEAIRDLTQAPEAPSAI